MEIKEMFLNLGMAMGLGAVIAARPWRRLLGMPPVFREMAQAQLLIAVAGAIAVTVVGDNLARAFGLVGLGGFIRFRTGIRDPRDAAVFFLLIGIGMACGAGAREIAVLVAAFVAFVLVFLDMRSRKSASSYLRLVLSGREPLQMATVGREIISALPMTIRSTHIKLENREVRFELENPKEVSVSRIEHALLSSRLELLSVSCESVESLKGGS